VPSEAEEEDVEDDVLEVAEDVEEASTEEAGVDAEAALREGTISQILRSPLKSRGEEPMLTTTLLR